jgi:Flp pilus assembly protein TadD
MTIHFFCMTAAAACAMTLAGCAAPSGYGLASARAAAVAPPETPINPQSTYVNLIQQLQQKGLWFASLAHIDAYEQQNGVSPETQLMRGDALRQTGQLDASAAIYQKLMGSAAEAAGYRGLGLIAGARGDFPLAVQMLEQAQRRNPTDAIVLSDLAYAYMRSGRLAQARIPVMQASQLQPELAKVQGNLALFLLMDGQRPQADAVMERARMSSELREAIQREAQRARPVPDLIANSTPASGPLRLKISPWPFSQ